MFVHIKAVIIALRTFTLSQLIVDSTQFYSHGTKKNDHETYAIPSKVIYEARMRVNDEGDSHKTSILCCECGNNLGKRAIRVRVVKNCLRLI